MRRVVVVSLAMLLTLQPFYPITLRATPLGQLRWQWIIDSFQNPVRHTGVGSGALFIDGDYAGLRINHDSMSYPYRGLEISSDSYVRITHLEYGIVVQDTRGPNILVEYNERSTIVAPRRMTDAQVTEIIRARGRQPHDLNGRMYQYDFYIRWVSPSVTFPTNFTPQRYGFAFDNHWEPSLYGPLESFGLCAGISFTALDYYYAGVETPASDARPSKSEPLYTHIWLRQVEHTLVNIIEGASAFPDIEQIAEAILGSPHNVDNEGTYDAIIRSFQEGRPVAIGLVPFSGLGHVVVGYQVEENIRNGRKHASIKVYDPNEGRSDTATLELFWGDDLNQIKDVGLFGRSSMSSWKGIRLVPYSPHPIPEAYYRITINNSDDDGYPYVYLKSDTDPSYRYYISVDRESTGSSQWLSIPPGVRTVTIKWSDPDKGSEDMQARTLDVLRGAQVVFEFTIPRFQRERTLQFGIELRSGWNLFSVPNTTALSEITQQADRQAVVWYLNPIAQNYETPTILEPCKGYWIYSNGDYTVRLDKTPAACNLELYEGWNMISAPTSMARSALEQLANIDRVYYYNPAANDWETPTVLEPGRGYFVRSKGRYSVITSR